MNNTGNILEQVNPTKLEWLEPSFELLHDPEGGGGFPTETDGIGPS